MILVRLLDLKFLYEIVEPLQELQIRRTSALRRTVDDAARIKSST
jgi:hypothetical protein